MNEVIFERAQALAEALRDSETFQTIKNLEATLVHDDDAMAIMQQIASLEQEISAMMQDPSMDQTLMADKMKAYQQARIQASQNMRISMYEQAQEEFNQTMKQMNQVISAVLSGRDPAEACSASGSCSGSCSSCAGC